MLAFQVFAQSGASQQTIEDALGVVQTSNAAEIVNAIVPAYSTIWPAGGR